jgi:hypothetical protein
MSANINVLLRSSDTGGELAVAPRGAHHTFANLSGEALEPWPEVTVVGPTIPERLGQGSGPTGR